ncbi:MAG: hypothetical protein KJ661_05895 [Candidatus Omnitrophica bacterium]|nr:hypothetical protein [Candidatus Omnitrophota bacterium]
MKTFIFIKVSFAVSVIVLFSLVAGICYANEGFLCIKDDTLLYNDKECKSVKSERPLYKFTFGDVQKKEAGKIYIRISNNVLNGGNFSSPFFPPSDKFHLAGFSGWITEDDAILFQYSNTPDLYDKARRIFLKKYFP